MRVHVALTPGEFGSASLDGRVALVVDVFRASTTVVAACAAGCRRVIPVADAEAARALARQLPGGDVLVAGERGGDPIAGFDLGNSPLEFTPDRVRGRTIVLTTTNGTGAMIAAGAAAAAAVAALTNLAAASRWALDQGRDVTILCSGERGHFSLEDAVCAGLVVDRLVVGGASVEASDAAVAARRVGQHYLPALHRLGEDARWARKLADQGRSADLAACLALSTVEEVPRLEAGAVVPARWAAPLEARGEAAR